MNQNSFGRQWIDLLNTVQGIGARRSDALASSESSERWIRSQALLAPANALESAQAEALRRLRGELYDAAECLLLGDDGAALGNLIADRGPFHTERWVSRGGEGWHLSERLCCEPGDVCTPIVWSCALSLSAGELSRLRRCANPECVILFIDESRNGSRQWCSMKACGNRDKVSKWRSRHR